jgi:hypothetical protein
MFRTRLISRTVFKLISAWDLEDQIDAATVYIGLGDQFDDDRRLVREAASTGPRFRSSHALASKTRPTAQYRHLNIACNLTPLPGGRSDRPA